MVIVASTDGFQRQAKQSIPKTKGTQPPQTTDAVPQGQSPFEVVFRVGQVQARLKLRLRLPARHRITAISPSSPLSERVDIKTWGSLSGPPVIISQGHDRLTKLQAPHHSRLYRLAAPISVCSAATALESSPKGLTTPPEQEGLAARYQSVASHCVEVGPKSSAVQVS